MKDEVSQIKDISGMSNIVFPNDLSFFEPYLRYHARETLEAGGEAYLSRTSKGVVSGLFLYDEAEKAGTIYTRSREVFDYFYGLKPFSYLFAEMKTEHESEVYDIHTVDLEKVPVTHRFRHEISVAEDRNADEIERFMVSTHPGINRSWVKIALKNGEKSFTVRLGKEITGVGWVSMVSRIGRLHSLYVEPRFRRLGIGEDILHARLLWLKTKRARSAFSEISRDNIAASRIAMKEQMRVSGQIFLY